MNGYWGKLLKVDLSRGQTDAVPLRGELADLYIGGSGIGARLLFEELGDKISEIDPLSAENPLIFMTGPFSGTTLPSTARMTVNALSPLTGLWGEANVGGQLAAQLKFAGWDGIIITGTSTEPVYLQIADQEAKLLPAGELWGKDTFETTDMLQELHLAGSRKPAVATIGPAGEKGVLYAAIAHNKGHHFGRTGMGAVMGAKKLKALVVTGSNKLEPGDPEGYKSVRQRIAEKMKESMLAQVLNLYGTNCGTDLGHASGDVPIKNWRQGEWYEGIEALNGMAFDEVLTGRATCYACPVACKRVVEVKDGPFKTAEGPGPEYETIGSFGTMCMIPNAAAISRINDICNRVGLDTISCGCTIAFAMECYEKGLLSLEQTGGLELKWGDAETVIKLVELIAAREGFGEELSYGSARLAEKLGKEAQKCVATVKKLEAPMHDPRAFHGLGLSYATGIRGACHVSGVTLAVEQGTMCLEEMGLEELSGQVSEGKAKLVQLTQDFGMAFSTAAVVCILGGMIYTDTDFKDALKAVTGKDWSIDEILESGRRNWMLKRSINLLRGARAEDDNLPETILTPVEEGGAAGSVPDLEMMMKEFYQLRGFDEKGFPAKDVMDSLGLDDVFLALEKIR